MMRPCFEVIFEPVYAALKSNRNVEAYERLKAIEESLKQSVTLAIKVEKEKKGKKKK